MGNDFSLRAMVKVHTAHLCGIEAFESTVEISVSRGIGYYLIGLPDAALRESSYRLASALAFSGYRIPGKRITLNITPAGIPKNGPAFDLALAIGILMGTGQIPKKSISGIIFWGELGLDGSLNATSGVLSVALMAKRQGFKSLVIPEENRNDIQWVNGIDVFAFKNLREVLDFIRKPDLCVPVSSLTWEPDSSPAEVDFGQIRGQPHAKRGLELAATGGHHILMVGPPGIGKTLLARAFPGILPDLLQEEAAEINQICAFRQARRDRQPIRERPFRSPHHSISRAALMGGGHTPLPGEISFAHHGVLFLDELTQFKREVLESLREPLEEGIIRINRGQSQWIFPARFLCVASTNPSPDGYFYSDERPPRSTPAQIRRYLSRLSGPFLDRFDLQIELDPAKDVPLPPKEFIERSISVKVRVEKGRQKQLERFKNTKKLRCNAQIPLAQLEEFCPMEDRARNLLDKAIHQYSVSLRARHQLLKLARTIADLEEVEVIDKSHIAEAIRFRIMRKNWLNPA